MARGESPIATSVVTQYKYGQYNASPHIGTRKAIELSIFLSGYSYIIPEMILVLAA